MKSNEIVIRNVRFKEVLEGQRLRKRLENGDFKGIDKEKEKVVEIPKIKVELPKVPEQKKKAVEKFYQPQLDKKSIKIVDRKREKALESLWAKLPPKAELDIKIIDFSRYFKTTEDVELGNIEGEFLCVGYNYLKGLNTKSDKPSPENSEENQIIPTDNTNKSTTEINTNKSQSSTNKFDTNKSQSSTNTNENLRRISTNDNGFDTADGLLLFLGVEDRVQSNEKEFVTAYQSVFIDPDIVVPLEGIEDSPWCILIHKKKFISSYKHILKTEFSRSAVNNYRNLVVSNVTGMLDSDKYKSNTSESRDTISLSIKPPITYRKVDHKKGNYYHFDTQIRQFATNRYNRQVLKSEKDQQRVDRELDGCTFKPKINPIPNYLKDKCYEKLSAPLRFIKDYAMKFTEDKRAETIIESLEHCTFQPNLAKHIRNEWELYLERRKKGEVCDGTLEAMLKQAYDIVDYPFENLYQSDLDWWLENYKDNYVEKSCDKNCKFEKHQIWKKEMREPLYSGDYSIYHSRNSNYNRVVAPTKDLNKGGSNHWHRWKDNLRGGYLRDNFDHSGMVDNGPVNDKVTRYISRDWGQYIRLKSRNKSARVLPNKEIIDSVCLQTQEYELSPLPTVWDHRAPLDPKFQTQSALKNKAGKVTTFLVPTPIKQQNLLHSHRLHTELRDAYQAKSFLVPPKVVAVKRDKLRDLEDEINQPQPKLLLEEFLYHRSEDN